jgi:hypothetical protein
VWQQRIKLIWEVAVLKLKINYTKPKLILYNNVSLH